MEQVERLFRRQQDQGAFPGGQLVVMQHGRVVHEVSVGLARREEGDVPAVAVTPKTRFQVMSASKPFVAWAVAQLEGEGALSVDAPVARYFPEFAAEGKGEVTVLEVLTHRSGVLLHELSPQPERWPDPAWVVSAMAGAKPTFRRGTLAYSPYAFGWILAEVVRRVSGEDLQTFLLRRLPEPVRGVRFLDPAQQHTMAKSYWLAHVSGPVLAGVDVARDFEHVNQDIVTVTATVPGAGLLANAHELAAFYDHLLAERRAEPDGLTSRYTSLATSGIERQFRVPMRLGRGFNLGALWPHAYGWWNTAPCFGHAGGFGVLAWADPRDGAAIAIVTNGHRGMGDLARRFAPLGSAIRRALR